ncbi:MAG: DNA primase [Proteobacteria bacterium]|nr:DNA primase [Pseudomonadota bacterium]
MPFERLRYRQQVFKRYLDLFSGREDCFARQWVDKQQHKQGYVPVRRPLEPNDLEDHFKGLKTYGFYLLKADGSVKTAVIDVDLRTDYRGKSLKADERNLVKRELYYLIERITELSEQAGLRPLIEFSGGKGYHFWYFFDAPLKPEKPRAILEKIKKSIVGDLSAFAIEVFPKQDHLKGKGLGNLVKLPLGVHRLTGKRSYFVKCHNRSIDAQLDFLSKVQHIDPEKIDIVVNDGGDKKVFIHPRWEKWAKSYPELFTLESRCPPLAQVMAACRNRQNLSVREEKIILQTIGFLPRAKTLLHHLLSSLADYNPHLVDYKLSRIRGAPLGCRRIHSLLSYTGDWCRIDVSAEYLHPLLHLEEWKSAWGKKSEKVENLSGALEGLKAAIIQAQRFLE